MSPTPLAAKKYFTYAKARQLLRTLLDWYIASISLLIRLINTHLGLFRW